jgi:glycosyltransferase 2 family protein
MKDTYKKILNWGFSLLLVIAVVVYFYNQDVDWLKTWEYIQAADPLWVILSIPIILLSHWVRAVRWKTMMKPVQKVGSTWTMFKAVMIGYAVNCVLPRGGEFVRPLVYSRREKVSYSSTFGTIVVERFIDVISLLILFGIAFLTFQDLIISVLPEDVDSGSLIFIAGLLLVVMMVSFYPPVFDFLLKIIVKSWSEKFYEKLNGAFNRFKTGFAIIKTPSAYTRIIIESALIWFFYIMPMYLMFNSFDYMVALNLGFSDAFLLLIVSGFVVTIAPLPGQFGVYHAFVAGILVALYAGLTQEQALAYATLTHGVNFLVQFVVGGVFFFTENIKKIPLDQKDLEKETVAKS